MRARKSVDPDLSWQTSLLNVADAVGPISHELNNLFNNMVLQVALLERAVMEPLRDKVSVLRAMPLQASQLLQKLNDYRHQIQPPSQAVNLTATIRAVIGQCQDRGWSVTGKFGRNLPLLRGNPQDVTRLADLLISAGHRAGPPVQVTTKSTQENVLLEVGDAGPSVEAEKLEGFFDSLIPARLGENSLERAACHTIARRLGAELEVQNLPGRGLVVIVKFPSQASQ